MKYKRGRLGPDECKYIAEHVGDMSPEEIAAKLNKTIPAIRNYILTSCNKSPVNEVVDEAQLQYLKLKKELIESPEWKQLSKEFDPTEIKYFEHRYVKHIAQFKHDMTPTEETQVFNLIKLEIFMHRNREVTLKTEQVILKMERNVNKVLKQCRDDRTKLSPANLTILEDLEKKVVEYREYVRDSTREYLELQKKHNEGLKDLKGTRDQRISKIHSGQNFLDLLKALQEEKIREMEGKEIEYMKIASADELKRLSEPHKYLDGVTDQPILNHETIQ